MSGETDAGKARLLIPDTTPLSLLALAGDDALDLLFVPGLEVWVTDMVREEAVREPDADADRRSETRAVIRKWLMRNSDRIRERSTEAGEEYRKAMTAWDLAGRPSHLKPSWRGRGEASILEVLDAASRMLAQDEAVVVVIDDRRARAALRVLSGIDLANMATETFLTWLSRRFGVDPSRTEAIWLTVKNASRGRVPPAPEEDPIIVRGR